MAKAVIHNGCTTGIEAFIVKLPAIAYRPHISETYDLSLPNSVSFECFDVETLCQNLERILQGEFTPLNTTNHCQIIEHYIAALDGPLACDRIVDVLEQLDENRSGHRGNPEYLKQRFPGVSTDAVRERINRFAQNLNRFENVKVEPASENIFKLHP